MKEIFLETSVTCHEQNYIDIRSVQSEKKHNLEPKDYKLRRFLAFRSIIKAQIIVPGSKNFSRLDSIVLD